MYRSPVIYVRETPILLETLSRKHSDTTTRCVVPYRATSCILQRFRVRIIRAIIYARLYDGIDFTENTAVSFSRNIRLDAVDVGGPVVYYSYVVYWRTPGVIIDANIKDIKFRPTYRFYQFIHHGCCSTSPPAPPNKKMSRGQKKSFFHFQIASVSFSITTLL